MIANTETNIQLSVELDKTDPRVGKDVVAFIAIDRDNKYVHYLGTGKYVGNVYQKDVIDPQIRKLMKDQNINSNPLILLDNGKIVFGFEAWWLRADKGLHEIEMLKRKGYTILDVDIDDARQLYNQLDDTMKFANQPIE
jgi:hypothetical protein